MQNYNYIVKLAVTLSLILSQVSVLCFEFASLVVNADSKIINAVTTYQFDFNRMQDSNFQPTAYSTVLIQPSDTLIINFPSTYTLTTVTCIISIDYGSQFSPTCTVSANKVIASNIVTTATGIGFVSVWVSNIKNPSPAITTDYFTGTIGSDTSASGYFASSIVLQPGTFASCYSTFSPTTVNSTGDLIITLTPSNSIASTGYIVISFPITRRWINDISTTNFMPISSSMSCSSKSANVLTSIQCSGDNLAAKVTSINLFNAPITTAFSYSINSFLSPPTNQQSDVLVATSYAASGDRIDTCNFYVSDLTPKAINSIVITSAAGGAMTVNQFYTIRFVFTLTDTLSQTDTLTLVFPTGSVVNFLQPTVSSNFTSSTLVSSFEPATLTLYVSIQNSNYNFSKNTILYLSVGSYQAPPSIEPTLDFKLTAYRNNQKKLQGFSHFSAVTSTITGSISSVGTTTINMNTAYTFQVILNDAISSSGKLKIIVPSSVIITATQPSCASVTGSNVVQVPVCNYNSTENSITLTSMNSSLANIGAQTLTIVITGLRNPSSASATGSFSVRSYYRSTDTSLVATGTISGITATSTLIDNSLVSVSASSLIVNDIAVAYSLQYKVAYPIQSGGYITVLVPQQISVDLTSVSSACSVNINASSFVSTPCSATNINGSGTLFNFSNPLSSDATLNTVILLRVSAVFTNPQSTRPTSSFALRTFSPSGAEIAYINSAITIQMTTPTSFDTISITRASNKNNDITIYSFSLTQKSVYEAQSVIGIGFPNNVVPSTNSTCTMSAPSSTTLVCAYSGSTMKITLPASTIASGAMVRMSISNILNPASFQPTGVFTFTSKTVGQLFSYSSSLSNPALTNSIPTNFQSLTFTFTPTIYGESTSLQINFNPTDSSLVPAKLRLTLANSFSIQTLSCNSFIDFVGTCSVQVNNTIQVTGNFSNAPMAFSITGFTAPINAPTDYSSVVTLDSGGYKLDESLSTIIFSASCTMPCRTCSSTAPASCTSCYSNINISTFIYYDSALNRCYDNCPSGKFANIATLTCNLCDTNCLTCVGNATFCLTCNPNSTYKYMYVNSGTVPTRICLANCPINMFPDPSNSLQCTNCVSPCATCTSISTCLSCVSGKYYINGTCASSCPVDVYIANTFTNACDPCSTSCRTCSTITTNCTSCVFPLLIYQFQCLVSCPSPLVPQNNTCGPCDSNCLTCIDDPINCTSCNTNSSFAYLLNYRCLNSCPDTYYNNMALGICTLCSTVTGLNCIHCSSVSTCASCNTGYVLMAQTCLNYTPSGYVNISGIAQPCTGDCLTCSISQNNCTSCINYSLLSNICYPQCPSGYIGISHICQPCTSPCATCSGSLTTCLSCLTLTPRVYLSNSRCVGTCPDGTYASNANNTCVLCSSPCQYCLSTVNCLTCLNGFYIFNQTCNTVCPSGYAGVNRVCQPCQGNCATCQNSTTICTSCQNGTYLYQLNNSCVTSCGNGLYVDIPSQTCVYCTPPCKTCTNTSTTCLSCLTGALYNSGCLPVCPAQYFNLSGLCQQCPQSCAMCTSLTSCSQCTGGYLLYNGFCITDCPATNAVVSGGACTLCSGANCHQCTSADVCTMCNTQYSLLNGACLSACPASYTSNGTHCIDINQQVLTTPNSFPVPFSIAAAVILVACLMSKLQFNKTFLPGAVFAFLGLLEVGSLGYFLYLYYENRFTSQPFPFFIGVAAIAYMMLLNFLALLIQNIIFCMDKQFSNWCIYTPNKCSLFWVNILSTLICHKFRNILFCKLFSFTVFSAQLQNISKFKVMNIFSFLSLIHSGAAIFSVAVSVGSTEKQSQIFYQCIDVIVVTSLNVFLAFFNVMKSNDFFFQMTPQGYQLKKRIKAEEDYYSQKIDPIGQQIEDQQKIYAQSVYQVHRGNDLHSGLMSTQALKPKLYTVSEYKDESYGSLVQPEYQDISIQAVPIIDHTFQDRNVFDLTQINKMEYQQQNSNYTTIFNKSSKGVQNTIDHGPSLRSQGVQMTEESQPEPIEKHDVSIQPTNRKMIDQSVQRYDNDYEPVDRSVQRTVFFRQDQSIQYAQSMKLKQPSMKDMSVSAKKVSFKDQSIQQTKSNANKSIMYQPSMKDQQNQKTISRANQSIQIKPSQQSFAAQAVQQQSQKGNQKTISVNQKSVQINQSVQNKSIQHQNLVRFDQFQQDINPTKTADQIIFEEQPVQQQQKSQRNQLKQQQQDEFLLPKQQITSYQEQLQQRIRQKQKQLSQIKRKIQMQQRKNNDKGSKLSKTPTFIDNSKQIGGLQVPNSMGTLIESNDSQSLNRTHNNAALKKQNKQVQQQVDAEIDKTIEEIEVINDQNQVQQQSSLKELKEKDVSKLTEEQVIGMLNLEEHPQKIIFDNSEEQEEQEQLDDDLSSNRIVLSNKKQSQTSNPNRRPLVVQYGESEAEISSGKDWSTKIYSSSRQTNNLKANRLQQLSNNEINEPQNSVDYTDDPIIEAPIHPYAPHSFSDMSQTIQQMHPNSNLNMTGQTTYLKQDEIKSKIQASIPVNLSRARKQVPADQHDNGLRRKFQSNSNASMRPANKIQPKNEQRNVVARKSSLIFAGKTQLIDQGLAKKHVNRDSPLKAVKRWQYDQDNRNIQQSGGQQQVKNTRAVHHAHLIAPMETDKVALDFRTSRIQASNVIKMDRQPIDQISPYIGEVSGSAFPNKPSVYNNKMLSDFGNEEQPEDEPYIQQQYQSQQQNSQDGHRNNMILAQMLHRPVRSELEQYYNKKPRRSKQKQKDRSYSNNMSFNSDSFNQTQKIYNQKLGQDKRR